LFLWADAPDRKDASVGIGPLVHICDNRSHLSLVRGGAVAAQYFDLGGHDLRWPGEHRKAARHDNFLRSVCAVGDHAAGDRAAELLAPKPLAVGGIERNRIIEVGQSWIAGPLRIDALPAWNQRAGYRD
jgi:hypothetical protein